MKGNVDEEVGEGEGAGGGWGDGGEEEEEEKREDEKEGEGRRRWHSVIIIVIPTFKVLGYVACRCIRGGDKSSQTCQLVRPEIQRSRRRGMRQR